jgi:diacylglycerol O-acyltransferase
VKRLRGWDAVLLYSETPNVHMHTLKLAVIELDGLGGRKFGIDEFRKVIHGRLYKLDPFRYQLIEVPGKIHHALADGVASANLLARGMDPQMGSPAERDSYATDPAPTKAELLRSAFADHVRLIGRLPCTVRYTAQGIRRVRQSSRKLSPELTRPFTPPPTFMNHMIDSTRRFATAALALADIKQTGKHLV